MTNQDITHLTQAIIELKGQIERMSERQEEMVEDVKKIKEAVYNPDQGLYARLRSLEQWAVIMTLIGLVTTTIYKLIMSI